MLLKRDAPMHRYSSRELPAIVSPKLFGGRTDISRRSATVMALAGLSLPASCRNAEDAPPAEVRPVHMMTIESRAIGDTVGATAAESARVAGPEA